MEASKLLALSLIALVQGKQGASNQIAAYWWIDIPFAGGIIAGEGYWVRRHVKPSR
jgi:hypothetical protein